MSLKNSMVWYANRIDTRLNDDFHKLGDKTSSNVRDEAPLIAKDFKEMGYKVNTKFQSPSQITKTDMLNLVEYWKTAKNYDIGTMQNKMTALRHIMKEAGNTLYKITNGELGISSGRDILNASNLDKSYSLSEKAKDYIGNRPIEVQASIKLMESYGFRKDEALKATWAIVHGRDITKNGKIYLMPAWTKNGNYREFEMHDRGAAVKEVKELVKNYKITGNIQQTRGLIDRTFTFLKKIDGDQAHPHGLRHEYAHFRYYQITGMTAPAAGGLKYAEMDANQRKLYHNACKTIAPELGHTRETISRSYIGK